MRLGCAAIAGNALTTTLPPFLGAGDFVYRSSPVPVFAEADGVRMRDTAGRTYLDAEAANGTLALGYDASVLRESAERLGSLPALPSFCESEQRLRTASMLEELLRDATGVPGRVAFEVGGAQGIELAMKVVAANRGWGPVVTFQGGYHGRSPFTSQLSSSHRYRALLGGMAVEAVRLGLPDPARAVNGAAAWSEDLGRAQLHALGAEHSGVAPGRVAALVLEPVLNVGGMALPPSGFLREVVDHLRGLGALIVLDEVFTGFHRTGPRFGFELHGIEPDIVVMSKALTNGLTPLSAVWAREPLMDAERFSPGTHSSTLSGTPLALAVAETVMARLADGPAWTRRVERLQARLGDLAGAIARDFPDVVASAYAQGAIARLVLRGPWATTVRARALDPASGGPDVGVLVASTGMAPDVIALHPPLTIGDEDLALVEAKLRTALEGTR